MKASTSPVGAAASAFDAAGMGGGGDNGSGVAAAAAASSRQLHTDYGGHGYLNEGVNRRIEIPWKQLSKEAVEGICRAVVDRETEVPVRVLDLMDNQLGTAAATKITSCLESSPVTEVMMRYNDIGKEGCDGLAAVVNISSKITTIDVRGNNLSALEAKKLIKAVATSTSITTLGLANNKLGPEGAALLAKMLEKNTYLTYLDVSSNELGPDGAASMAKLIATPTSTIQTLLLYGNYFGATGVDHVCRAMCTNKEIRRITLGNNNATDAAAATIADMLKNNYTLESLDIRLNTITPVGIQLIAKEGLSANGSLTALCLSGNPIGPVGADSLARALITHHRSALTFLDFSSCGLETSGGLRMASLIGSSITLKEVNLSDNALDDEAAAALAENLATSISVSSVDLSANMIREPGAQLLVDTAQMNPHLTCLVLHGNIIGRVVQKRIDALLEERIARNRTEIVATSFKKAML